MIAVAVIFGLGLTAFEGLLLMLALDFLHGDVHSVPDLSYGACWGIVILLNLAAVHVGKFLGRKK
ncbi:hypothetical protein ACFWNC_14675 [Streptomyces sp. NPDC058369]|uniref:hypothetical protein n=1 Tax=Streptomyces sp. NPDC058369 TaxID=3346462 RepID=UPI00365B6819